jgi:hypothetical protein
VLVQCAMSSKGSASKKKPSTSSLFKAITDTTPSSAPPTRHGMQRQSDESVVHAHFHNQPSSDDDDEEVVKMTLSHQWHVEVVPCLNLVRQSILASNVNSTRVPNPSMLRRKSTAM